MAQQAHILHCIEFDAVTHECITQVWMPAQNMLLDLTVAQGLLLGAAAAVPLATAWGMKLLSRHIQK